MQLFAVMTPESILQGSSNRPMMTIYRRRGWIEQQEPPAERHHTQASDQAERRSR